MDYRSGSDFNSIIFCCFNTIFTEFCRTTRLGKCCLFICFWIYCYSAWRNEKLIGDIDYWKARALEEEKIKQIYKIRHINKISNNKRYDVKLIELKIENQELKRKIKELEKEKVTFISFKGIKALNEA